jgi:predicted deacetylase
VELHEVAPSTWPLCRRILARIDGIAPIPVSLLVVPDYHHRGCITRDSAFVRAITARQERGDELALHGLHHADEGPIARTPAEWFDRRLRSRSQGEFAATDAVVSAHRIARGLASCVSVGWRVRGFVPPAWLLGRDAWTSLRGFGFSYVGVRDALYALPSGRRVPTTTLSYAAFSPLRRALGAPLIDWQLRRAPPALPIRLAIHPIDARHPGVLRHWERIITALMTERTAMHAERIVATALASGRLPGSGERSRRARPSVASRP